MENTYFSIKMLLPRYWLVWFGVGLWWLLVQILPFKLLMYIGSLIGRAAGVLSKQRSIIARKNIALCFPELSKQEQNTLFWKTMASTGRGFVDAGIAWFWPYWRFKKLLHVEGMEQLDEARNNGQGVILFTYHFTCLEIALASFNRYYPHRVWGFYRPHRNIVYDFVMRLGRERHGKNAMALPRKDVRGMVKALRAGDLVIYLPDQDYGATYSQFVPFFGVDAATISAPTRLAQVGRAKVFSYGAVRKKDNTGYKMRVYPPFENYAAVDEKSDALAMNRFLEQRIRENPEQYLWVHRRFKSRPDNQSDFYGLESLRSYRRKLRRRDRGT